MLLEVFSTTNYWGSKSPSNAILNWLVYWRILVVCVCVCIYIYIYNWFFRCLLNLFILSSFLNYIFIINIFFRRILCFYDFLQFTIFLYPNDIRWNLVFDNHSQSHLCASLIIQLIIVNGLTKAINSLYQKFVWQYIVVKRCVSLILSVNGGVSVYGW